MLVAQLHRQADDSGHSSRIHWAGMIGGKAKWGGLYGCEAMVLSSHQENFGVVVAEALGCARRVVISDQVNICGEVTAADAGFVAADSPRDFARALRACLAQPESERTAMEQRGRTLFSEKFEIAATARRLIEIFADARANRHIDRTE